MELKPGSRWRSAVSDTEVVVVKAPEGDVGLGCGGHPMVSLDEDPPPGAAIDPDFAEPVAVGKRFEHESGLEVLVTKGGDGALSVDGTIIQPKGAKPLPSSD